MYKLTNSNMETMYKKYRNVFDDGGVYSKSQSVNY